MKIVKVGDRLIGGDNPCFVILELGVNFKDMNEAKKLVDTAISIGADAVKFQTFHADTISMKGAILYDGRGLVDQHAEAKGSEDRLTEEFQTEIIRYAHSKHIITFSTPSHFRDVDLLNKIGNVMAYKFGSDDLTNLPLLKYAAKFKKPIFLSSGVSTISDIEEAIEAIRKVGNDQILLFHCVSQYPAKPEDMNLRTIRTLDEVFDVPVGLSDHTEGLAVSVAACTIGAKIIEKHFTLDRAAEGPDNFFSMEPAQMKQIIDSIREVEVAMGTHVKEIRKSEEPMIVNFHKAIFATKDIKPGEPVSSKNADLLRPLIGIPAKFFDVISGKTPKKRIQKGKALQWEDFK